MDTFHLIGIKGSGMSALAQVLSDLGNKVQGEDIDSFLFTQVPLETRNIPLYTFGDAPLSQNMKVIASNAYDDNHPSIVRCKQHGIPVYRYHRFLGDWMKGYTSVAITGAHGKTTTTGMMVHALKAIEPSCSLIGDGTGAGFPDARLFVFESCEYKRHFLAYQPDIAVITNIDFDHPDYFADIDDVRNAFEEMASLASKHLIACGDDPQIRLLKTTTDTLYYGIGMDNDLRSTNIIVQSNGVTFDVYFKDTKLDQFTIPVFGKHNVLNALAVIGVALVLDLNLDITKKQLATFSGVKRRFTEKQWGSNIVIDDYAPSI
jgi:UDP-N-acetylmuramate--alanine ligase